METKAILIEAIFKELNLDCSASNVLDLDRVSKRLLEKMHRALTASHYKKLVT